MLALSLVQIFGLELDPKFETDIQNFKTELVQGDFGRKKKNNFFSHLFVNSIE